MDAKVQKMLGTEELSLLQEVMAALQALLNSNNAGGMENAVEGTGAQPAAMALDSGAMAPTMVPPGEEDPEGKAKAEGEEAMKSNDGPTANENAEARTEDGTVLTEDNLQGVAKSLAPLLALLGASKGVSPVQKSVSPAQNTANETAQTVLKALEPALARIGQVEKDMNAMLEAFGVAEAMDTVEKSADPMQEVNKAMGNGNAPVVAPDATSLFKMLGSSIAQELMKEEQAEQVKGPTPNYSTARTSVSKELGAAIQQTHLAHNHKGV